MLPNPTSPVITRTEDFVSRYADNVRFEPTAFDLKIIFGHTDLNAPVSEATAQHTAITLPWPFVKLLTFYMMAQLIFQEAENGDVNVPPKQIPPELPLPPEGAENPVIVASKEIVDRLRRDYFKLK